MMPEAISERLRVIFPEGTPNNQPNNEIVRVNTSQFVAEQHTIFYKIQESLDPLEAWSLIQSQLLPLVANPQYLEQFSPEQQAQMQEYASERSQAILLEPRQSPTDKMVAHALGLMAVFLESSEQAK